MPDGGITFMFPVSGDFRGIMTELENGTVGITPGVKFHPSFVGLFDHELQRIIKRNRRLSLFASKPLTPGFQIRWVKRITGRPHLYNHSIHAITLMHIQLTDEL